ncbi:hypothetical protein AHF37_06644 [Paragonimus kellicotti]|nr:hypothetical protein AHF37_06644 [Paragonimus kellicotti]
MNNLDSFDCCLKRNEKIRLTIAKCSSDCGIIGHSGILICEKTVASILGHDVSNLFSVRLMLETYSVSNKPERF